MYILPKMELRMIKDCEPGDLIGIRSINGSGNNPALISKYDGDDDYYIVHLPNVVGGDNLPFFTAAPDGNKTVIWYGKEFQIYLDQTNNVDHRSKSWEFAGMLIMNDSRLILRASPKVRGAYSFGYVNIETGIFVKEPSLSDSISFGSWQLTLPSKPNTVDSGISLVETSIKFGEG